MKRTPYQQPMTEVVKLQQRSQLLTGSNPLDGQAGVQDYTWYDVIEE